MAEIDFFLSHNRAEAEWTRGLHLALRKRGATTFFADDSISLGQDIVAAISNGLQSCKHIVLVLTPRSVRSAWVELEWASVVHTDPTACARIVPVFKEECEIPSLLRRLRFLDARTSNIEDVADSLLALLSSIGQRPLSEISPRRVEASDPLRFGAAQYINRDVDSRVIRIEFSSCSASF